MRSVGLLLETTSMYHPPPPRPEVTTISIQKNDGSGSAFRLDLTGKKKVIRMAVKSVICGRAFPVLRAETNAECHRAAAVTDSQCVLYWVWADGGRPQPRPASGREARLSRREQRQR